MALALEQADPDDRAALVILAAVYPQLGAAQDGRLAGARAFRLSQTDDERYEAARLTALAAANEERYTLSQIWLRRAAINAPDDAAFQQTQSDYRGVRNLNPWSVNLGFSITPSSNVNGGSETEYNTVDGLPYVGFLSGDAQALSGVAATVDARVTYNLNATATSRTAVTARAYVRAIRLSDEAREMVPGFSNSDFGSQIIELSVSHDRQAGEGIVSVQALAGASWYGGELYTGVVRGKLGYATALSERTRITIAGDIEQTFDPDPWIANNEGGTLTTSLAYRNEAGNQFFGSMSYKAQASDNLNERFETITAQIGYAWAEPIGPIQLSVAAGASYSHFRDYSFDPFGIIVVPGGREDTRVFGQITAVMHDIDYAGFVPVVALGVQDTRSNVSRFDRDEFTLNIGIRSSF